jgi:hypothetical protein
MGEVKTTVVTNDLSVSTLLGRGQPRPARVLTSNLNLLPKTLSDRMLARAAASVLLCGLRVPHIWTLSPTGV